MTNNLKNYMTVDEFIKDRPKKVVYAIRTNGRTLIMGKDVPDYITNRDDEPDILEVVLKYYCNDNYVNALITI